MNCKPGDLAIVVAVRDCHPRYPKLGLIVRVVEFAPAGFSLANAWCQYKGGQVAHGHDTWVVTVERDGRTWLHGDSRLRPIRPGDLEDETPTVRELEVA